MCNVNEKDTSGKVLITDSDKQIRDKKIQEFQECETEFTDISEKARIDQILAGIRHVENMYGIIDKMLSDDPEYYGVMEQRIFSSHY